MKKVPYWVQGGIFTVSLVILIFTLKVSCPIDIGCFADPFLVPLFSPLLIVELVVGSIGFYEPFFIIIFWAIVGTLVGLFVGHIWGSKETTNIEQ